MAQQHEGPGFIVNFPEKHGGGRLLLRYLTLATKRRIRQRAKGDDSSLGEEMVLRSIAEASPDIADQAGVQGQLSAHGLVPVDDEEPGRMAVYEALGDRRRQLLDAAWISRVSVPEEDIDPFLKAIEDVA